MPTSTTSNTSPWAGAENYLGDVLNQARNNYANPPAYYPGQTYLDPTQGQLGAWDTKLGYNDAVFGGAAAPSYGAATGALNQQLSGTPDYSGLQASMDVANKPVLDNLYNNIIPGLNSRATFTNNMTGGIKGLNSAIPQVTNQMQMNNLALTEQERIRALGAQQQGLQNFGQIYGLGQQQGNDQMDFANWGAGFQNNALQDSMNRFNYYQNLPTDTLTNYANIVQGASGLGGQTQTTQTNKNTGLQDAASIAAIIGAFL